MHDVARRPLLAGTLAAALRPATTSAQSTPPAQAQPPTTPPVPAPTQSAGELRLGALYPFSGPHALLGDESFRGLEMAIEERNVAGGLLGRPLRLLRGDAPDAARAVAEMRRLLGTERAGAVFGTFASSLSLAASQVAEQAGLPYLELGAAADALTERGFRGLFRTCPRAADIGRLAADAVADTLAPLLGAAPRTAILHEDGPYGSGVAAAQEARLAERGVPQVERLAYAARGADLGPAVQRLRGVGAEVVLHTGHGDAALLFRAMREAGWRPRMVVGADAGYGLGDTARGLGPEFEGTMTVDVPPFASGEAAAPGARPFGEAYKRRYGAEPRSGHSLSNHFGALVCLDAMARAGGLDRDRVRAAMLATDLPEGSGVNGWGTRFDDKGQNTLARPVLSQWQDGRLVAVFPPNFAVAGPRDRLGPP